jgi:hypothetical protein
MTMLSGSVFGTFVTPGKSTGVCGNAPFAYFVKVWLAQGAAPAFA